MTERWDEPWKAIAEELGVFDCYPGHEILAVLAVQAEPACKRIAELEAELARLEKQVTATLRPSAEWDEIDDGDALWFVVPVNEGAFYFGTRDGAFLEIDDDTRPMAWLDIDMRVNGQEIADAWQARLDALMATPLPPKFPGMVLRLEDEAGDVS